MASLWDGAGNVVRTDGTFSGTQVWQDVRDGPDATISAQGHDTHDQGLADSIEDCLNRNGENAMAANIAAGGFIFTGVGDGNARDTFPSINQIQDSDVVWVDGGGTADAITATYTPNVTALVDGMMLGVRATAANATTTPTFKAGTTTAKTIVKDAGTALVAGDIAGNSHDLLLRYESGGDVWNLLNPVYPSGIPILQSLVTTRGDVIRGDSSGVPERLALGADNTVLASDGTDAAWETFLSLMAASIGSTQGQVAYHNGTNWVALGVGTSGQFLQTQGAAANPQWADANWQYGGTVDCSAGTETAIDILTGIASTVVAIELMFVGVSTDTANTALLLQIGDSGGYHVNGYTGNSSVINNTATEGGSVTDGCRVGTSNVPDAADTVNGVLSLHRCADNTTWQMKFVGDIAGTYLTLSSSIVTLDTALTQIQITTSAGTAQFDAGSIVPRYR